MGEVAGRTYRTSEGEKSRGPAEDPAAGYRMARGARVVESVEGTCLRLALFPSRPACAMVLGATGGCGGGGGGNTLLVRGCPTTRHRHSLYERPPPLTRHRTQLTREAHAPVEGQMKRGKRRSSTRRPQRLVVSPPLASFAHLRCWPPTSAYAWAGRPGGIPTPVESGLGMPATSSCSSTPPHITHTHAHTNTSVGCRQLSRQSSPHGHSTPLALSPSRQQPQRPPPDRGGRRRHRRERTSPGEGGGDCCQEGRC